MLCVDFFNWLEVWLERYILVSIIQYSRIRNGNVEVARVRAGARTSDKGSCIRQRLGPGLG